MTGRPRVETATGTVEGDRIDIDRIDGPIEAPRAPTLMRYLGIPYAAGPSGRRRFRAPEPPAPWAGIRPAHAFGPPAPQSLGVRARMPSFAVPGGDEDCLTLNVWTPAHHGRRPVLVWLHGGAYLSGGTAMGVFDGARLAAEGDVVVVTANYRLGALGFLAFDAGLDDAQPNCGLWDQRAAIEWVREHASALGGDPGRIAVFGESAGAGSILHLCTSRAPIPVARAIVQSGEPRTLAPELADRVRTALVAHLGITATGAAQVAALRAAPVEAILDAQQAVLAELGPATGLMPFHPTFDPDLVDVDPVAGFTAGRARSIDLVIGTTRDELALFPDPRAKDLDDAGLARLLGRLAGPHRDPVRIAAAYRRDHPGRAPDAIWDAARTDAVLRIPALRVADGHVAAGGRAYVYRFDWEAPGLGAAHAVDLPFTFGTFDRDGWGAAVGADDRAHALGRAMRAAWVAFAASGDPSHDGLPPWPPHDPATRPTMCFAAESRVVPDPDGAARAVWMDTDDRAEDAQPGTIRKTPSRWERT